MDCYSFIAVDFHPILLASLPAHSLALRPAHSHGHLCRDRYPKASDTSSPPCLLRSLLAGPVAGWGLQPLEKRRLVTAHVENRHSMAKPRCPKPICDRTWPSGDGSFVCPVSTYCWANIPRWISPRSVERLLNASTIRDRMPSIGRSKVLAKRTTFAAWCGSTRRASAEEAASRRSICLYSRVRDLGHEGSHLGAVPKSPLECRVPHVDR